MVILCFVLPFLVFFSSHVITISHLDPFFRAWMGFLLSSVGLMGQYNVSHRMPILPTALGIIIYVATAFHEKKKLPSQFYIMDLSFMPESSWGMHY